MKDIKNLTKKDIEKMNYNELISITKETNRPPGGINSIIEIINNIFINKNTKVLEVGTSTGFTSLELARLIKCKITAIDINELSIKECRERAKKLNIKNIKFEIGNVESLKFKNKSFDIVFCGNVTSIVNNREKALSEYKRVLKNEGYLLAIPMYYIKNPSKKLISDVSKSIRVSIKPHKKEYWVEKFEDENLEIIKEIDFKFDYIKDSVINKYVKEILQREHLNCMKNETKKTLDIKYKEYIKLFRKNLSHMGYSILIIRKTNLKLDEELFISSKI